MNFGTPRQVVRVLSYRRAVFLEVVREFRCEVGTGGVHEWLGVWHQRGRKHHERPLTQHPVRHPLLAEEHHVARRGGEADRFHTPCAGQQAGGTATTALESEDVGSLGPRVVFNLGTKVNHFCQSRCWFKNTHRRSPVDCGHGLCVSVSRNRWMCRTTS